MLSLIFIRQLLLHSMQPTPLTGEWMCNQRSADLAWCQSQQPLGHFYTDKKLNSFSLAETSMIHLKVRDIAHPLRD